MKPLILTDWPLPDFMTDGIADLVLDFGFYRFIWGPQPSSDELALCLGPRTAGHDDVSMHWSYWCGSWKQSKKKRHRNLSLAEFCRKYETVELWFDMQPRSQLKLVWLLDYFR